ncbi:MAG: rhomboid family intramembrane serine protease [Spirosomataceae bacterium]
MFQITPVVRNLLIANIAFYFLDRNFDLTSHFALRSFLSPEYRPYQYVSYMFLHGGFGHLFSNMFGLLIFGPLLERIWGPKRFLIFYFVTGIGAGMLFSGINYFELNSIKQALLVYLDNPNPQGLIDFLKGNAEFYYRSQQAFINAFDANPTSPQLIAQSKEMARMVYEFNVNIPMVGASGAIFGILMAFGMLFPNTELFMLFIPFPIKAKYFVAFYGLYSLYAGIQNSPNDNVAHFAHLGGMLFAYLLLKYWGSSRQKFY